MKRTEIEREYSKELWDIPQLDMDSADYEDVLTPFAQLVGNYKTATQSEIRLPYWMERFPETMERLLKTWGDLGARVVFVPLPGPRGSEGEEKMVRREQDLVTLWRPF